MEPRDFLVTAEFLIAYDPSTDPDAPTEADYRTAVGRAYYAAFLDARDLLESMGFVNVRRGNSHDNVRYYLANGGSKTRRISGKLSGLRQRRNDADYEIKVIPTYFESDARNAIRKADEVCKVVTECLNNNDLKRQVMENIKATIPYP